MAVLSSIHCLFYYATTSPLRKSLGQAAPRLGITLQQAPIRAAEELPLQLAIIAKECPDALFVSSDVALSSYPRPVIWGELRLISAWTSAIFSNILSDAATWHAGKPNGWRFSCAPRRPEQLPDRRLGWHMTLQTVRTWRKHFAKHRLDGLDDEPRYGAPRIKDIVTRRLETKRKDAAHWSTRGMAKASGVSASSDEALVICVDENSEIQALDRSQPLLPNYRCVPNRSSGAGMLRIRRGSSTPNRKRRRLGWVNGAIAGPIASRRRMYVGPY
jgi:hypothetical protein